MAGVWITLASVVAVWLLVVLALAVSGRRVAARELASFIPNLVMLFKGLLRDRRVPRRAKFALLIATAWIASPIDLIPEFIPVIGPLDDAIVAALVLRYVVRAVGREVLAEHWHGKPETLGRLVPPPTS